MSSVIAAAVTFPNRVASRIRLTKTLSLPCVRPAPRGAWGSPALWVVPPLRGRSPPFTKRGSHYKLTEQRGVLNFILHLPFYPSFSKIPDLPRQISFSKILLKALRAFAVIEKLLGDRDIAQLTSFCASNTSIEPIQLFSFVSIFFEDLFVGFIIGFLKFSGSWFFA